MKLEPQVVPFTGALTDTAEHRHAAVLQGDIVNQLHDDDGFAHARAAEQPDLAALQVRLEQVDHLDARLEHLQLGGLVLEIGRRAMNGPALLGHDRSVGKVDRLAEHIQHAAERLWADRHRNPLAEVHRAHAALHPVGRLHRDRADAVLAEMLLDFRDDVDLPRLGRRRLDVQCVVDLRQVARLELHVQDGADDLNDSSDTLLCHRITFSSQLSALSLQLSAFSGSGPKPD